MKKIYDTIACFFLSLRLMPLFLIWKYKQKISRDGYALLFEEDMKPFNMGFFNLIYRRPEYISILYHRLGNVAKAFRWFCGDYPFYISGREDMLIGEGIYIDHPHGSHINAKKVGTNFKIKHNVTVGNNKGQLPTIGNNVFIGCGGCVLGGVDIGNNVKIGSNCVVVKDIPDNATVIGNPAIIIRLNGEKVNIKV